MNEVIYEVDQQYIDEHIEGLKFCKQKGRAIAWLAAVEAALGMVIAGAAAVGGNITFESTAMAAALLLASTGTLWGSNHCVSLRWIGPGLRPRFAKEDE